MERKLPSLKLEKKLWRQKYIIVGVDEVGRGALAGPLVAGAVCFKPSLKRNYTNRLESVGINDSKKLSAKKREWLSKIIKKISLKSAIGQTSVSYINRHGIVKATQVAMRQAVGKVRQGIKDDRQIHVLSDAFYIKYLKGIGLNNQTAIVRGDEKILSIAAASIMAKVYRDNLMKKLAKRYPGYFWQKNKGYGTKKHIAAIIKHGKTKLHRHLFIRRCLL